MNRFSLRSVSLLTACAFTLALGASAHAAFTAPGLVTDINANIVGQPDVFASDPTAEGANFTPGHNVFASASGTPYGVDVAGVFEGNDVLVVTQSGTSAFDGAGFTVHVSNGENGDGYGTGGTAGLPYCADGGCAIPGSDPSNIVAADPVFGAIGNSSGRLENGNVVRFSTWVRNDPNAPLTVEPQIAPIVKLEFWRDALSGHADFTGGVSNPAFGSRIFDTDQNDVAIADPAQRKRVIDIDGDGSWAFGTTTEPVPLTTAWQQVVHTYVVDDSSWDIDPLGLDPANNGTQVEDVTFVEEIRGVMFMGDFTGNPLGGPGNLLWDNALIEIFADTTAEAASDVMVSNPEPMGVAKVPGDTDGDGDVDLLDLDALGANFGLATGATCAEGDFDGDGDVDLLDLDILGANFGTGVPSASVPEPASAALALLALAGLSVRMRK